MMTSASQEASRIDAQEEWKKTGTFTTDMNVVAELLNAYEAIAKSSAALKNTVMELHHAKT